MIIQNKDYAPGLALSKRGVSKVSHWWIQGSLLYMNLLVLLDHLLKLMISDGHDLRQFILYMHAMMQHVNIKATSILKIRIHLLSH